MEKEKKLYWDIDDLDTWIDNPRDINEEGYLRLKKQIKTLGEYKPLIINSGKYIPRKGEVLGGNMRLRAYRDLGFNKAWVSIVHPKTEEEKIKYALSDNDRAGFYVKEDLAQLLSQYEDKLDMEEFSVDVDTPRLLSDFINDLRFGTMEDELKDISGGLEADKIVLTFRVPKEQENWVREKCFEFDYDLVRILQKTEKE